MVMSVAAARTQIAAQIVDGVDNSITPSKLRQVLLDAVDALAYAAPLETYRLRGAWDADSGAFPSETPLVGNVWTVSTAGTVDGVAFDAGDQLLAIVDEASSTTYDGNWLKIDSQVTSADVAAALGYTPAPLASPTFTGTPAAPTASAGTNTTQLATTAFVQAAVADLAANTANAVFIKSFGAVGDGVVNDTVAVQAAIDQAAINGLPVYVSPGTYKVTTLTIVGDAVIFGPGTIIQDAATVGSLFTVSGTATKVLFRDLTLDGNQANQGAASTNCLINATSVGSTAQAATVIASNVTFKNPAHYAIRRQGNNNEATREVAVAVNCRFLDGAESIAYTYAPADLISVDAAEIYALNCDFDGSAAPTTGRSACIALQTQTATAHYAKVSFIGNRVRRRGMNVTNMLGAIDLYIWVRDSIIANNTFIDSVGTAIKWKANGYNIRCSDNIVDTVLNGWPGISINGSVYGVAGDIHEVVNNSVRGVSGSAITIEGLTNGTYPSGVRCDGNTIASCTATQIEVANAKNVSVRANTCIGGTIGITVSVCDHSVAVSNNLLIGQANYALYCDNNPTSNSVASFDIQLADNRVRDCSATYAVYAEGKSVVIRGNDLRGCVNGFLLGNAAGLITALTVVGNSVRSMSGTVGFSLCAGITDMLAVGNFAKGMTTQFAESAPVATNRYVLANANTW